MKKYYKVVNSELKSIACYYYCFPSSFAVQYKENVWIKPKHKGTRLFIFSSLEDAKDFAFKQKNYKIYECLVKNPRPDVVADVRYIIDYWHRIFDFRKKKQKIEIEDYLHPNIPSNTWSCTELKLIKLIEQSF